MVLDVDTEDHNAPLSFDKLIEFPGNYSKFMIKHDDISGYYYSVATIAYSENDTRSRNLLALLRSRDLCKWETAYNIFDYRNEPKEKVGFQYVDFEFENEDIIFLCRTALNGAHNYHDANYSIFDRIKDFRNINSNNSENI